MAPKAAIPVRLDPALVAQIDRLVSRDGCKSRSAWLIAAVVEKLERDS